jgi:hypothetical protein
VADSDNWKDRISFVVREPGWAYHRREELDAARAAEAEPAALAVPAEV